MQRRPALHRRTATNLIIDSAIFVAFLAATAPRLTGIAIHEWLSIAFGAAIVTHLLLHWQWIVGITVKFFRQATGESRVNYLLNALLFIDVTVILATGLLISEEALPLFGLHLSRDRLWLQIHRLSSDLGVFLIGLHVALHWRWIVNACGRMLRALLPGRPIAAEAGQPAGSQEVRS